MGRRERQKRNKKNKSEKEELVNQVKSGEEKGKDTYCNRCGDTAHLVGDCPNKGDLKCKGHPNSNSHTDLACYYYRRSQHLPINPRPKADSSKDKKGPPNPPSSQNLALANIVEIEDDVDPTDIYTSDDEPEEVNAVEVEGESDDIDPTEYFSDDEPNDEAVDTTEGKPPTPPRPREEAGAFCVRLDHDEDVDITEYFTESEDEGMEDSEWTGKDTLPKLETELFYSDSEAESEDEDDDIWPTRLM